jgi:hypothetical protein
MGGSVEILVGVIAFMVCVNVFALVYRSARSRRESAVLGFTMRIGLPLNDEVLDAVDRRVWHGLIGLSIGCLVALAGLALLLIWPQFIPTGGAGFAVGSILWAAMAIGGAVSALEQFASPAPGHQRFARAKTPGLTDYVHPGWVWGTAATTAIAAILTAAMLLGVRGGAVDVGLPLPGLVALTILALFGAIGAALLSRRLLAVPQPVSGELDLQWDDALRGYALRQLWIASIALSSAAIAVSYNWMVDATSIASYFGVVITLIPMLLFTLRPGKRSQRRLWSPVSTGIPG